MEWWKLQTPGGVWKSRIKNRSLGGDSTTNPLELVARDTPGSDAEDLTGPRAQSSNSSQHHYNLEDRNITIAPGPPNTITVNGVNIMNLQKSRKTGTSKEQGTKKNNKKKDQKKPTILTPSSEKITKQAGAELCQAQHSLS